MVDSTAYKRYVGTTNLYLTIDQRNQRSFLQRNLNHILDNHQKELKSHKSLRAADRRLPMPSRETLPGMSDDNDATWKAPTGKVLNDLVKDGPPVLRIALRGMRPEGSEPTSAQEHPHPKSRSSSPDWLPDRGIRRIKCNIEVKIIEDEAQSPDKDPKIVHQDAQRATLICTKDAKGTTRIAFDIAHPFYVKIEKFMESESRRNLVTSTIQEVAGLSTRWQTPQAETNPQGEDTKRGLRTRS
ncbi:hypothetical protein M8818_006132 [Zalaria obscura]|uniref:Uncharacterized protein n=1 Tax=Zalaria obscura TaxID=2024903 RepID=A0ACC3S8U4_9PEZI